MAGVISSNPIAWLHLRLYGGWRRLLQIVGVAALVILFVHVLFYRALDDDLMTVSSFCTSAFRVMAAIQAMVFLMGGPGAIKVAIQRDFTTEMITSHRQTGMRGESVVLGYLIGPTVQVSALTLLGWLTCTILALLSGGVVPVAASTLVLVCLLASGAMYWTLAVLSVLASRGTINSAALVILVGLFAFMGLFDVVPGLGLLTGVGALRSAWSQAGAVDFAAIAITLLSQIVFAAIIFAAAARKYARDDVPAFSPLLAFVLLAFSALLAAVGLEWVNFLSSSPLVRGGIGPTTPLLATIIVLLLVAFLPVGAAARACATYAYLKSRDAGLTMRKPRSFIEAPLAATLIVFAILGVILLTGKGPLAVTEYNSESLVVLGTAALSFLFSLMCVAGVLRFVHAYTQKVGWVLLGYVIVFCALPLLAEVAMSVVGGRGSALADSYTWLFGCSPIGTWAALLLHDVQAPLVGGLIFQGIVAVAALVLATRARH